MGVFAFAIPARAQQRVLLLEDGSVSRPGLLSELRIHLSGVAEVESHTAPLAVGVLARIAAATAISQREHALLAVWVDGPAASADGSTQAVLYLVGQRQGRALLEVVRVPGGSGPDLDRTLALKVRVAVDELQRSAVSSPGEAMLAPSPVPVAPAVSAGPRWGAVLGVGAMGGPQDGASVGQWGGHFRAGPSLLVSPLRFSLDLGLGWFPALRIESAGDSVRLSELAPGLALHAQLRQAALWLGLRSGASLVWVQASGRSRDGARGPQGSEQLAVLENGFDVELPIAGGFGVELALLLQTWLDRQRFAVNGMQVADLGRLRPLVRLSLTWVVPSPE